MNVVYLGGGHTEMSRKSVFLYANQPLVRCNGEYFSKMKNFVDFLSLLATTSDNYNLIIPCRTATMTEVEGLIKVQLPKQVIEVAAYDGHVQALLKTIPNAFYLRSIVSKYVVKRDSVTIAGPGPNSMLFILSWILPKSVNFAFFIRGDTARTVSNMYKGRPIAILATALVGLFQKRIYKLLRQRRAIAFTYGPKLAKMYSNYGAAVSIAPLIDEKDIMKKQQDIPAPQKNKVFRVLFVGRLSQEKGVIDLVDACELAARSNRPFCLTIVGHGTLSKILTTMIREKGIERWVSFIGYVPHGEQLLAYYDEHDLLCLPSYTEGVPRVVVEAFARSLPVAATPVGSIPELFTDHVRLIKNNDPASILDAIDWCRSNPDKLYEMALNLSEVARMYTLEHYVNYVHEHLSQFSSSNC